MLKEPVGAPGAKRPWSWIKLRAVQPLMSASDPKRTASFPARLPQGSVARENVHSTSEAIAAAIRLLTDFGFVVLKAPNCARDIEIALERPSSNQRQPNENEEAARRPTVPLREFMTIRGFCGRYSISRSTAYARAVA